MNFEALQRSKMNGPCLPASPLRSLARPTSKILCCLFFAAAVLVFSPHISTARADFGFLPGAAGFDGSATDQSGLPFQQAGGHPFSFTTSFYFKTFITPQGHGISDGSPKDLAVNLPPGIVGNPNATPRCTPIHFSSSQCPEDTAVGVVDLRLGGGGGSGNPENAFYLTTAGVYNLVPRAGVPAELGFHVANIIPVVIDATVRTGSDYGLNAKAHNVSQAETIAGASLIIWGVPAASAHDAQRCSDRGAITSGSCPSDAPSIPFLALPTACSGPQTTTASADSWQQPGAFVSASFLSHDNLGNAIGVEGCNQPDFSPTISTESDTAVADSPDGLRVDLHIPQNEDPNQLAEANLKAAAVTLPTGLNLNPASADGLAVCSSSEIALHVPDPGDCPGASKLGTVEVDTPLIDHPLPGAVYLAKPFDNPFNSLLALYIDVEDPQSGVIVKLAGHVKPDPQTGRLTTTFDENPQLPFEDLRADFFDGPRSPLRNPQTCGTFTTESDLVPWTSPQAADATPSGSFSISQGPNGSPCSDADNRLPHHPTLSAGSLNSTAGSYSPFVLKLSRADGSQEISTLNSTLPEGLLARLAGVPYCPDAAITQALSRSNPDHGAIEQESPSCPSASQIGSVRVAAGAGPNPLYVSGKAYLAGPYRGAPLSLAVITPAIAGPFDLGTVVVRAALQVDPATAQVKVVSDQIPTILQGIPLDVRSIAVNINRNQFTLNPTNCNPSVVSADAISVLAQSASLTNSFQVGGCAALPFKPKLALSLSGATKRTANPKLIANLSAKPGEANIARAQVKLPPSAFLDNAHIGQVCTRVQFAADSCPAASIYGSASATSPLVDYTLAGPVYLRSSSHQLPDLVVKLKGPDSQPLEVDLVGRTDSVKGALRNTFEAVPDAPVSRFHLELFGGKRGLIEMSSGFCSHPRASVKLDAQNGKVHDTNPVVRSSCPKGKTKHRGHH